MVQFHPVLFPSSCEGLTTDSGLFKNVFLCRYFFSVRLRDVHGLKNYPARPRMITDCQDSGYSWYEMVNGKIADKSVCRTAVRSLLIRLCWGGSE